MSVRWTQVKRLDTVEMFQAHCVELGIEIPIDDAVDPDGVLAQPVEIRDGASGSPTAPIRFAVLPMEGWDGTTDGHPTDLVRRHRRYLAVGEGRSRTPMWSTRGAAAPRGGLGSHSPGTHAPVTTA